MTLGWFFGRMGCFVAHDHPGTETEFWLGVYGICQPGGNKMVACHDMGLYEALWSLSMFGVFQILDRFPLKPGTLVLTLGLCYGPLRFAMDYLRPVVTDVRYGAFTPGQYWAAVLTLVCVGALVARLRSTDSPMGPAAVAKLAT
jgi:phosphatidylglycerol:prolipoprotein diacylglycerol transferase